jgi:hypothetical protein
MYCVKGRFNAAHWRCPNVTRGVSNCVALPFTLKTILRQKKNYGNLNISPYKNIIFKKIPLKETEILQDIIITLYNQSQVSAQAKISSFKNPHIKIDLLPRGQNPLSYYILLYNVSKHNIKAMPIKLQALNLLTLNSI